MKHVYFVRHGQTEYNIKNIVQPPTSELDEIGLIQAEKMATRVAGLMPFALITSNYKRAIQTAEVISLKAGIPYVTSDFFREVGTPTSLHGATREDDRYQKYIQEFLAHQHEPDWHYEDEENFYDMVLRCKNAKEFIESRAEDTLVVVSHGLFLKYFFGYVIFGEEFTYTLMRKIYAHIFPSNVGLSLYTIDEHDMWQLLVWNDHSHLG